MKSVLKKQLDEMIQNNDSTIFSDEILSRLKNYFKE